MSLNDLVMKDIGPLQLLFPSEIFFYVYLSRILAFFIEKFKFSDGVLLLFWTETADEYKILQDCEQKLS